MLRAIDPPPDRTAARKRKRDNDVFDGSANVIASLEGSTSKLESTLKALSSSVHTLRDVTEDFGRIRKVTQFERKYELVTQSDIGVAQSAIAVELAPQIQSLIQEAEILLNKLAAEEAALETKLEEQEQQVNRLRTESASLPSRTDINQRKRRTDEHMKQLKRLRQKKASLSRAIQQSQHEVKAKDDALTRLEKQTLDLEPQLKMVENAYNANIPTKEQESRRQQLLDELTDLKRKVDDKRREYQEKHLEMVLTNETVDGSDTVAEPSISIDTPPKEESDLSENKDDMEKLGQLKSLCKVIFPENDVGKTAGRLLEILLTHKSAPGASSSSASYEELQSILLKEFPVSHERRHHITTVIRIFHQAGIF